MVWEIIFLLLILKIPMVYLCAVVWWAIRAEPAPPEPLEPALVRSPVEPDPRPGWRFLRSAPPGAAAAGAARGATAGLPPRAGSGELARRGLEGA